MWSPSFLFPAPLPWFWLYQLCRPLAPSLQHTLQCIHFCSHLHHLSLKDTSMIALTPLLWSHLFESFVLVYQVAIKKYTTDWTAYKQQTFIRPSSGDFQSEIKGPAWLGEGPLLSCRLFVVSPHDLWISFIRAPTSFRGSTVITWSPPTGRIS